MKLLAENGANLNSVDVGQFSCTAIEQNNLKLLKDIVYYGGDITFPKKNGTTALHIAVSEDNIEMVKFLIDAGANVDQPDVHGWTPKALADQQGHEEIKELFQSSSKNTNTQSIIAIPQKEYKVKNLGRFTSEPNIRPSPQDASFLGSDHGLWQRPRQRRSTNNFHNSLFGIMSAAHTGEKENLFSFDVTRNEKSEKRDSLRITISCPEKGDDKGKLVILPSSFQELLEFGAKKFGIVPIRLINKDGAEIDNIDVIRDGDHLNFVSDGSLQNEECNTKKNVYL